MPRNPPPTATAPPAPLPMDAVPYRPAMNSDLATPPIPITELHIERATRYLTRAGKDAALKAILKKVSVLDEEFCRVTKAAEAFGRNASRARWFADMAEAVQKADGREVHKKSEFIEAQLRRMRPLKARTAEITKEASPFIIELYELLIGAFSELEAERVEEERAFAGGEDFVPSLLLQSYRYARQKYLPTAIRRLKDTPGNRRPAHLLLGVKL